MKKNEIIELNGVEYTLELNRDSFLQIDRACNVKESMAIINEPIYTYIDDIDDDFNPESLLINDDEIEAKVQLKEKTLFKLIERALLIWLYPNHKLNITQIREIIKPILDDEEKSEELGSKIADYLQKCVEIRQAYNEELKNLKAQANKK